MALTSARMQSLNWLVPILYKLDKSLVADLLNGVESAPPTNQFQHILIPLTQFTLLRRQRHLVASLSQELASDARYGSLQDLSLSTIALENLHDGPEHRRCWCRHNG